MGDIAHITPKWSDPFEVPASLIPDGMTYQWCAKRADSTQERDDSYEKMLDAGWVLVPQQWVPGGRNMIAGNDLMCRPKFLTERAQLDNEQKAAKLVDDWVDRTGGQFSGGMRVWTGDASPPPEFRPIGNAALSKTVIGITEKPRLPAPIFHPGPFVVVPVTRKPRRPWLRWLFNLASTEE